MGRKWNNIKRKKKPKKIKILVEYMQNLVKEIYVAAKSGSRDPESNQALRLVLERAKHILFQIIL